MGGLFASCCEHQYNKDRENELNDGRVVHEPAFSKTDEEVWELVDNIFNKYDINMDGVLDQEELRPWLESRTGSKDASAVNALWKELDEDGDGVLTKDELFEYLKLNGA